MNNNNNDVANSQSINQLIDLWLFSFTSRFFLVEVLRFCCDCICIVIPCVCRASLGNLQLQNEINV